MLRDNNFVENDKLCRIKNFNSLLLKVLLAQLIISIENLMRDEVSVILITREFFLTILTDCRISRT